MSQGFAPFYDVNRTYEDNYLQGPFGAFAEVLKSDADADASEQSAQSQPFDQAEEFLGFRVNLPFGIPAGPLLNERFTTAAFHMASIWPCIRRFAPAHGVAMRSRTCLPCIRGMLTVRWFPAVPNLTRACLPTPAMSFRFRFPTVLAFPPVIRTSGSRICKRRSRRPAMASCWCRAFRIPR